MALVRHEGVFPDLVGAAAQAMGLDPSLVEKDYWAVEVLRAVHAGFDMTIGNDQFHIRPIFKGGTSLSKSFGLIERFSEDIDLLVPVPGEEPKGYSANQRAAVMKSAVAAVTTALGINGERSGGRRGIDLHWKYPYEPASGDPMAQGAEPNVRLELTVMGGKHPTVDSTVRALVAEYAASLEGFPSYDDLTPVLIKTLAPERTLVEKLAMLHDAASGVSSGNPGRLIKAGRHYYDVAMLLRSDDVLSKLDSTWVAEIAADADYWSDAGGYPFTVRPAEGFAASPAFNDTDLMNVVQRSYELAMTWVWGEQPTLDECLEIVKRHADLL